MSTIVKSRVQVAFDTDTGYVSEETWSNSSDDATLPLKGALREIARVLTINGEGDEAVRLVAEAKAAVEEYLKEKVS
jgi:hypothetical protein